MTINLTELRDEPLGKHPNQAYVCLGTCFVALTEAQQDVVAADDGSSYAFDVEGLGDEALDDSPSVSAYMCPPAYCITCHADGLGDEALDPQPPRLAYCMCIVWPRDGGWPRGSVGGTADRLLLGHCTPITERNPI